MKQHNLSSCQNPLQFWKTQMIDIDSNPNFPSNVYEAKFCSISTTKKENLGKKKRRTLETASIPNPTPRPLKQSIPMASPKSSSTRRPCYILGVHLCSSCGGWAFLDPPTARVQVLLPPSTRPGGYKKDCSALKPSPVFASGVICEVTLSLVPSLTLYSLFNRHLGSALLHNQIHKVGNWNQFLFFSFFFLLSILWYSGSVIVHKKV